MVLTRLDDLQPKATKTTGKKPAPSPYSTKSNANKQKNPLFEKRERKFGIGTYAPFSNKYRPGHSAAA